MLLATLFLIFAKKLARFLTRGLENPSVQVDEKSLSALERVAFSVLGAYLIVYAAPTLVRMAAIGYLNATRNSGEASFSTGFLTTDYRSGGTACARSVAHLGLKGDNHFDKQNVDEPEVQC